MFSKELLIFRHNQPKMEEISQFASPAHAVCTFSIQHCEWNQSICLFLCISVSVSICLSVNLSQMFHYSNKELINAHTKTQSHLWIVKAMHILSLLSKLFYSYYLKVRLSQKYSGKTKCSNRCLILEMISKVIQVKV